ncbi:DUF488 domain-containing protein [Mesorhizobium sp. BR1-1-9]|uniref:DUF488 domain-containing protein n=1 Tax=unclassified Mesorhizobium TaxID=325217 RepID=UPI001126A2B8|nr:MULTISPECIES: DUF488 domain-containing protein [unclassified Mesorhizobium]MBZ9808955.1 DUF488 domain-containing protein [Mesorhizobium sp. ESP-6-2]MBZ9869668.1 DUF488 domain-containing protein [Mesorhizobium sp. BR1-1-9]MBZ9940604.1 DUF488 domain-containing protein [Mesorhizobium sp. BR1-1-13]TPM32276.1 DUF488 domain-containing protein [Mesorhizobium sp. B2-2-2]
MAFEIAVRRVYEAPAPDDGQRVLVDRVWPRGVSKEHAALALWLKDVAPSDELRKWFGHEPARWAEFQKRYRAELDRNEDAVATLRDLLGEGKVTLLYGAHDEAHNNAVALAKYLLRHPRA